MLTMSRYRMAIVLGLIVLPACRATGLRGILANATRQSDSLGCARPPTQSFPGIEANRFCAWRRGDTLVETAEHNDSLLLLGFNWPSARSPSLMEANSMASSVLGQSVPLTQACAPPGDVQFVGRVGTTWVTAYYSTPTARAHLVLGVVSYPPAVLCDSSSLRR